MLRSQLAEANESRTNLQHEIKSCTEYMVGLEERVYEANKRGLDLLKSVRDLELESSTLKSYIIDLKARVAVYVPIKNDPVD